MAAVVALALAGLAWWLGQRSVETPLAEYQQITFRTGSMGDARFTPDGSIVYLASWDSSPRQLYMARTSESGSRELGIKDADLLAISKNGELALRLDTVFFSGYAKSGTLARVPLSGGTPREVVDNVQDADWAADGEHLAVVRHVPETRHWRLEYPVGKVLLDTINWISTPKISPDGKRIAFADHENAGGDDEGSIAVIEPDGQERKLSSGWGSIEGVVWSPAGDEIWFAASRQGSAENLRGVTLRGKLRTIANVPGRNVAAGYPQRRGADGYASDPAGYPGSGSGRKRGARVGVVGLGRAARHEPGRRERFCSKKKGMEADRTTPCSCETRTGRLRCESGKGWARRSLRMGSGWLQSRPRAVCFIWCQRERERCVS